MNINLYGKTEAQIAAAFDLLTTERDHYKRELGLMESDEVHHSFIRRWKLTVKEAKLVAVLFARKGRTVSSDHIMEALYNQDAEVPAIKIVQVFVCKIRNKIGFELIDTIWGAGFALSPAGVVACEEAIRIGTC